MEDGATVKNGSNQGENAPSGITGSRLKAFVIEWVRVIFFAIIIALPIRYFIAEPFIVSGPSMDPTFLSGQFLIVDRLTYRFDDPSRGDVIVFRYPNNPKLYYIKRIIGLPGETVVIDDGKISIENPSVNSSSTPTVLDEPFIAQKHISHDTLRAELKQDEYFVMGDNRNESSDSRAWGPLPKNLIIGRPFVRLFPLNKLSILPGQYEE